MKAILRSYDEFVNSCLIKRFMDHSRHYENQYVKISSLVKGLDQLLQSDIKDAPEEGALFQMMSILSLTIKAAVLMVLLYGVPRLRSYILHLSGA